MQRLKEYNLTIDIIKGLAICSVVLGHCGFPFTRQIYLFHMAVFLMASGYCFKESHVKNIESYKQYVLKKIMGLWLPYFMFNSVCWLLYNKFIDIGFLTDDVTVSDAVSRIGWIQKLDYIIGAFHFEPYATHRFCGADWFVIVLFYDVIVFALLFLITNHIKEIVNKLFQTRQTDRMKSALDIMQHVILIGSAIVALIIGWKLQKAGITLAGFVSPSITCYSLYVLGYYLRKCSYIEAVTNNFRWPIIVLGAVALYKLVDVGSISLNINAFESIPFLLICSLIGWIWLWAIAKSIEGVKETFAKFSLKVILAYIGKKSLYILFLHFLAFKATALLQILIYDAPFTALAKYPAYNVPGHNWWPLHFLVGVGIPLIIEKIWRTIKEKYLYLCGEIDK